MTVPADPGIGTPALSARTVEGRDAGLAFPGIVHPDWAERWPWLTQGLTWKGTDGAFDLGLAGTNPVGPALARWKALADGLGFGAVVVARQVHGARVLDHAHVHRGLLLTGPADGHATAERGLLLAVSVADCVPVHLVAPGVPAVALLHAGWRGTAAGILEDGIAGLTRAFGCAAADLHVHLGPAICGRCYEVGPEVYEALGLRPPERPEPLDLRRILFRRAVSAGVEPGNITAASACTRCESDRFFSYRAGASGRQIAWLGLRST